MGIDYYLCRKDTGTVFALGRWAPVVEPIRAHATADDEILRGALRAAIVAAVVAGARLDRDPAAYADEVTRRVRAFAGGHFVEVVADQQLCDNFGDPYRDDRDDLRVADSVFTHDWGRRP